MAGGASLATRSNIQQGAFNLNRLKLTVRAGGLVAAGIAAGSPTYHQFFQVTQSVVDPVDPASITTPVQSGLPSRLSVRIVVREAVGDRVIPNANTRYFGNALGDRGVLGAAGAAVAPGFDQFSNSASPPQSASICNGAIDNTGTSHIMVDTKVLMISHNRRKS